MSEQDKKNEAAAGLPGVGNSQAGDVDWRKRAEDTERELQKASVEQGRVKSLAQRNKELEEELAKAALQNTGSTPAIRGGKLFDVGQAHAGDNFSDVLCGGRDYLSVNH